MLTQNELAWFEEHYRTNLNFCRRCKHLAECQGKHPFCPLMRMDLLDALEFSERVSVKLARWDNEYHKGDHLCPYGDDDLDSYIPMCHCIDFCQDHPKLGCIAAKLAWARLAVEEEMDNG